MVDINSCEWWENSFKNHWEASSGREQTEFFCSLALEHLPKWIIDDITENHLSICDAGCAEGQGTNMLASFFTNSDVVGIDFSGEAISRATEYFPQVNFFVQDISHFQNRFDVVYCSNTLEHFSDPIIIMENMQKNTNRYLIILVPYQEYKLCESHFCTFDKDTFPIQLDSFQVSYSIVIDSGSYENTRWGGQQVLVVYKNENLV